MSTTIPISHLVNVTPSALGVAGGVTFMNGLIITANHSTIPPDTIRSYSSASAVAKDFTPSSLESQMAEVYFSAYTGAAQAPSTLHIYAIHSPGNNNEEAEPEKLMNSLTALTQDFAGFTTTWEPTLTEKQAFATWTGAQKCRYWYVPWDTDPQATVTENSTSFGAWLKTQNIDGTTPLYKDPLASALCLGWMASLDFDSNNGRMTLAQRRNGLVPPSVTDATTAHALQKNGYSFYGAYANGLGRFQFLENGAVSGQFLWADSYINQIWLNASFQSDLLNLLLNTGQIPYTTQGDGLIAAAVQDTINQALAFGAIRSGVMLTEAQKQQIDNAASSSISTTVQTRGWYFQSNASRTPANTRVKRGSPPCRFWYTDGQSVQSINLASIEVQ